MSDDKGPTWNEGWDAHAKGWGLHEGATEAYRRGWLAREAAAKRSSKMRSQPSQPNHQ